MGSAVPSGQRSLPPPAPLPGGMQRAACPLPAWPQGLWHTVSLWLLPPPGLDAPSPAQRIFILIFFFPPRSLCFLILVALDSRVSLLLHFQSSLGGSWLGGGMLVPPARCTGLAALWGLKE